VVDDIGMEMPTVPSRSTPGHVLKGRITSPSTLTKLSTALDIHYSNMMQEILRCIQQTAVETWRLPADTAKRGLLPVEGFAQLDIPVPDL